MFHWGQKKDEEDRERLIKDQEELNKRKYVEAEIKREKEERQKKEEEDKRREKEESKAQKRRF